MENFSCSKGRPPDEGVPDVLMADDVAIEDDYVINAGVKQCALEEYGHSGAGDISANHVDIETCDQTRAETTVTNSQVDDSEPEEEKEPLSYDLAQGDRILVEIMSDANKSLNWPFMDPVDTEGMGLSDYHQRVKEPMWLRKMRGKMDRREYETITQIVRDFRLMLENCYRYNGPDHYISKRGQKLEIVFEQKLGLLSRGLREKTSIAATSGKPIEDKVITGTRRRKILTPHDSSDLLNQLRAEEKERERESRKQLVEERRQHQQALIQEMFDWEDGLLGPGGREYLYAMWELPQIGHFLFLTADALNTGEVMQWELERSFWIPRQSPVLQIIMTSLLSTPYQRTRLDSKPPMPYKIWEEKLRTRVRNWYKIFNESNRDPKKTHQKIGLEELFFKIVGLTNPLERRKFHELSFYQRVWIVKSLCDWCLATQESVREAIELQPLVEQRHYSLGTDAEGNSYIHFPQFCGQDLRVYRVKPIHMPRNEQLPKVKKEEILVKKSPKKKRPVSRKPKPVLPAQSARLKHGSRNKLMGSSHSEDSTSSNDSGISESDTSDQDAPSTKSRRLSPAASWPSTTTTTPTKGRSSRTSAAARDWMPRDCSLLHELTGTRRSSRSQRLTCAPVASGESTPTTVTTPSGSRESTPVPITKTDNSSRSSTPSLENTSSRASSPHKQLTDSQVRVSPCKKWRKCSLKKGETDSEDGDESECEATVAKGSGETSEEGGKIFEGTSLPDINSSVSVSTESKTEAGSDALPAVGGSNKGASCVNGYLPPGREGANSQVEKQLSLDSAEVNTDCTQVSSDTNDTCDNTDSKRVSVGDAPLSLPTLPQLTDSSDQVVSSEMKVLNCSGEPPSNDSSSGTTLDNPNAAQFSVDNISLSLQCNSVKQEPEECSSVKQEVDSDRDGDPLCASYANPGTPVAGVLSDHSSTTDAPLPIKIEPHSDLPFGDTTWESEKQPELYEGLIIKSDLVPGELMDTDHMNPANDMTAVKMEVGDMVVKEEPAEEILPASADDVLKQEEEEEIEPEIKFPEVGPFQLVADTVEMLRELTLQFAEPEPILEIKGKKEKILRPPPRKQCVRALYERLCYLLKELEPWESKLVAVNKKSRASIRKQVETFVELIEPEEVEDVWESEESASEDSNDNEDSDDNEDSNENKVDEAEVQVVPIKEIKKEPVSVVTDSPTKLAPKTPKKLATAPAPLVPDMDPNASNDPEKSSFGRVRKRKVIPNSYDEPPVNKKKKSGSPSPTPNILQSSRAKTKPALQLNSIDLLCSALSRAKPVATPKALPPGMQLLNIGGQNVLLNTNTKPPVILQTSAPLNLNNLTLLTQLSAKAAAGNSLGSKIVDNNSSGTSISSSMVTAAPVAVTSHLRSNPPQPPQQAIRTLLAAGNAPQHPKTRLLQPAAATKITPVPVIRPTLHNTQHSSSIKQLTTITQSTPIIAATSTSTATTMVTCLPPSTLATQVVGQSLLQPSTGTDGTRPQFYKYNDLSQMKATIRQQLVKTSQGVRTKSSVSTVPPGGTALSNLIQAGLLPQAPRMTTSMVQPAAPQIAIVTRPSVSTISIPVKSESTTLRAATSASAVSAPVARTAVVASVEAKQKSILSQVLASTGPAPAMPTGSVKTDIPPAIPTTQLQVMQKTQIIQTQTIQAPQLKKQPPTQTPPTHQIVINPSPPGSVLQSPPRNSGQGTVTILTSPQKSPTGTTHILPKGHLSPEFKAAVKKGIINESNIAGLIHANPGLVKALNSTMRPKYASNVTVKSLLESRALRQKAQLHGDGESIAADTSGQQDPDTTTTIPNTTTIAADGSKVQVPGCMSIPVQNNKSVAIQIQSIDPAKSGVLPPPPPPTPPDATATNMTVGPPHVVISGKPQLCKPRTLASLPGVMSEGATSPTGPPTVVSKSPIQLQAVRTPQGTILRTITGQQVTVRPAGARIQVGPGGQQVMRLVSPTETVTSGVRLVTSPRVATPTLTSLDEAVKSVVTSVCCSIPNTPLKIAGTSPFSAMGHQPLRQVTMTTSTMQAPIPSVPSLHAVEPKAVAPVSPVKVVTTATATDVSTVRVVAGQSGQKNVVLRVVPQQVMTSQGVVNMVVPQHLITQSLKAAGGSGKLVLQSGKGGLQLVHSTAGQTRVVTSTPTATQPVPTQLRPMLKTAGAMGEARTIMAMYPPNVNRTKATSVAEPPSQQAIITRLAQDAQPPQMQIKLLPGTTTQPPETLVMKKEGGGSANPTADNLPTQTTLIQKSQLQQARARLTSPVKAVSMGQSGVRVVSPQLTLSSAGLVPVQVTLPSPQESSASQLVAMQANQPELTSATTSRDHKQYRMTSPGFMDDSAMGDVTSSLDLLAAASMLQEAKAPLPQQLLPENPVTRPEDTSQIPQTSLPHQSQINLHQHATVLEQQIKLQQQILEGQQKQQKIIRQLTLQQEVAMGGQSAASVTSLTVAPKLAPPPPTPVPVSKVLVTTAATRPRPAAVVSAPGTTVQMSSVMATASGRMVQLRFAVPTGMNVQQLLQTPQFQQHLVALRVSTIHGIITSTVAANTIPSVTSTMSTVSLPRTHAVLASSPSSQLTGNSLTSALGTRGINTVPVMTRVVINSPPVKLMATSPAPTRVVAASPVKTPIGSSATLQAVGTDKHVGNANIAGIATAGLSLPQTVTATQQGSQSKLTVLVNVNGQLMPAQGLSLGNNMRVVTSVAEPNSASVLVPQNATAAPRSMHAMNIVPAGTKTMHTISSTSPVRSYQRLITSPQHLLTSPTKVTLQQTRLAASQKPAAPRMLVSRTTGGKLVNPVRLAASLMHQGTVKTNLLSQLTAGSATTQVVAPGSGIILTKPLLTSNASSHVATVSSSTVAVATQNETLRNGK